MWRTEVSRCTHIEVKGIHDSTLLTLATFFLCLFCNWFCCFCFSISFMSLWILSDFMVSMSSMSTTTNGIKVEFSQSVNYQRQWERRHLYVTLAESDEKTYVRTTAYFSRYFYFNCFVLFFFSLFLLRSD